MEPETRERAAEPTFIAALELLAEKAPEALRGPALDLACGRGRHALLLARRGIETVAIDRDPEQLAELDSRARDAGLPLRTVVQDLEAPGHKLDPDAYSLAVVVHYLHRPLCPEITRAIRVGGALFYETFTRAQAPLGKPSNPDFLLESGELPELFGRFHILRYREGPFPGPCEKASMLAIKLAREEPSGRRARTLLAPHAAGLPLRRRR